MSLMAQINFSFNLMISGKLRRHYDRWLVHRVISIKMKIIDVDVKIFVETLSINIITLYAKSSDELN